MTVPMVMKLGIAFATVAYSLVPTALAEAVPKDLNRNYFPDGFIFGSSSSAYQTEGAWNTSGKGHSIWDQFTATDTEKATGLGHDEGIDFYNRYEEDIELMEKIGLNAFRFSISWPRLLPHGKRAKGVSQDGVNFYNNVINKLRKHNIEPWVTIYHWDVPLALENEYGGFLSKRIVEDYKNYARLCFELFGDRVKHWMTINEPWTVSLLGYGFGFHAPGRCSCLRYVNPQCAEPGVNGDSATEPYIVTHNMLLAHASAVEEYRRNFKDVQRGKIGFSLCSDWFLPVDNSEEAQRAVNVSLDWSYGWHLSPLTYGKYPDSMRTSLGKRLPEFTEEEKYKLIKSYDFVGLNYYGSAYAIPETTSYNASCLNYFTDYNVTWAGTINGLNPEGLGTWSAIFSAYPKGIRYLLDYTTKEYEHPAIYITENGVGDANPIEDTYRLNFYKEHIWQIYKAMIEDGANVKGFFKWSFMDSYEWSDGYNTLMGIVHVDRANNLTRTLKKSGLWYKSFLNKDGATAP